MSITSATTALVARDHIPSDVADLSNCLCLFVLTMGDGTPLNASSILQEDIIEICIWFGHTHPEGVLGYSRIESVVLFHTVDELQVTMLGVIKASMLHEDAMRVRTSPPSSPHVRAYIAVVTGEPSGTQPLPSDDEEEPHLSPSSIHPGGRTPQHLQANLGDLTDNELWKLMAELCWEIALQELNAPQKTHLKQLGEILWDIGIQMWMTGRLLFQVGEGGFSWSNHFNLLPLHNQMEGGSPEDNLLTSRTCSTWWGCGVPNQYTSHGVATQYPSNEHLQQRCYTR